MNRSFSKKIIAMGSILLLSLLTLILATNLYIIASTSGRISDGKNLEKHSAECIIVTQKYHLYRAVYIADSFGLEVDGVNADQRSYTGQTSRDLREILARVKDFASVLLKPEPKFLGDPIPISGNPPAWE